MAWDKIISFSGKLTSEFLRILDRKISEFCIQREKYKNLQWKYKIAEFRRIFLFTKNILRKKRLLHIPLELCIESVFKKK